MTPVILQVDQKGSGAFNTSQVLALGQTVYDQQNQLYITGDGVSTYKVLVARGISARAGHPLTRVNDTNITLSFTAGTPATALLEAVEITAGWSGQLSSARGGFGIDTSGSTGFPSVTAGVWSILNAAAFRAAIGAGTGSGTVTSVSGTANRISSTGGATPVIDIDAAYVGQTSITTLGTVTTGVWSATAITAAKGGTGIDTSASTGFPEVTAGVWSIKTASDFKTDLSLNNVENTALSTWAGSANITTLGTIANYGSTVTANNGVPISVGTPVHLSGQTAAIASTALYAVPATGFYQICWNAAITTQGTVSSILGAFQVSYTDPVDSVLKTFPTSAINFVTQTNANTTGSAIGGNFTVYAKTGTNINYIMGYTSNAAASMNYDLSITVLKL